MRILLIGGGSGGHTRPLASVLAELDQIDDRTVIGYVGAKSDKFADLIADNPRLDQVKLVNSGKLRRYQDQSILQKILDWRTNWLNFVDVFQVIGGFFQSLNFIRRFDPDVVFSKGGFPSVPVALAAAVLRKPIITHDSDIRPGIANRLVSRWSNYHLVANDPQLYDYEQDRTRQVGVPLDQLFTSKNRPTAAKSRQNLGMKTKKPVVFIVGGSIGAGSLNQLLVKTAEELAKHCHLVLVTGSQYFDEISQQIDLKTLELIDFIGDRQRYFDYLNSADLVVTRSGATSVAEIAALGKPAIVIPAAQLADQVQNAAYLEEKAAAVVLTDSDIEAKPQEFVKAVKSLTKKNSKQTKQLSQNMADLGLSDSSKQIAEIIYHIGHGGEL